MFENLDAVENRYEQIGVELTRPEIVSDNAQFRSLMKEHSELTPIVEKYRELKAAEKSAEEARRLLEDSSLDADFKELAEEELKAAQETQTSAAEQLKLLLLPKDPNDSKNVIVEIRAGAGGEEAALFAAALFRMYTMYAEEKGWKQEILNVCRIS